MVQGLPVLSKTFERRSFRGMASWAMKCGNCGEAITHSPIDDTKLENFYFPLKPAFPDGGTEFECPTCGHKEKYSALDLFYRE